MSNPTPFQIGQQVSENFAPLIRQQTDDSAIGKIFARAEETGAGDTGFDSLMAEIVQRVSPQNQKAALGILQDKKKAYLEKQKVDPKVAEKQENLLGALGALDRQQEIVNKRFVGSRFSTSLGKSARSSKSYSGLGEKERKEYERLGKSLIKFSTLIPITNRVEFAEFAEGLTDPNISMEEAQGNIDAMRRLINNQLKSSGYKFPQEQETEKLTESVEVQEGSTATGPQGKKLIFKGGSWQAI